MGWFRATRTSSAAAAAAAADLKVLGLINTQLGWGGLRGVDDSFLHTDFIQRSLLCPHVTTGWRFTKPLHSLLEGVKGSDEERTGGGGGGGESTALLKPRQGSGMLLCLLLIFLCLFVCLLF